jgi:sporulation related protein
MFRIFKIISIIILMVVLVTSCQQALVKKEFKKAEVDSSLFFKQVEIHDPFLENLTANPNQSFTLNKTIIPPSPPESEKPKFKTIEGFRVQIFAGVDSINALANKNLAQSTVTDTIYHFSDNGLVKLQVGDYPYYPQADSIKRIFRQTHFPGAWVVKTNIFIPIIESRLDSTVELTQSNLSSGMFKIQVIATGDESKAEAILKELKTQFNGNAFYEGSGNIFKVYVGYFNKEDEARNALKTIREGNYPDAWLVY